MTSFSNKPYSRSDRLADRIQNILANIFIKDYYVEKCDLLTITNVNMTSDLRLAKVYLSFIGARDTSESIIKSININVKHIRYLLGKQLEVKYVPEIRFYYDDTIKNANKINSILKKI